MSYEVLRLIVPVMDEGVGNSTTICKFNKRCNLELWRNRQCFNATHYGLEHTIAE